MKKNVVVFGLISGVIVSAMMLTSVYVAYSKEEFEGNMVLGFAMMLVAFSFIYIGMRNYRNNYRNGSISLWDALKAGLGISFVACTVYVVAWMILYYTVMPDWIEVYAVFMMRNAEKAGATASELAATAKEMDWYREQYKSPFGIIWLTYMEVLVIAIPVTLVSALILMRKQAKLTV